MFDNYSYQVLYVGQVEKLEPSYVNIYNAKSSEYKGKLIKTNGRIVKYNAVDGNFTIDDGQNEILVQIERYLNLGMDRFKLSDYVSVSGIVSIGEAGERIRVR